MYKILVTGGYGFIGSNFIYYCLNKNNKVLNFDKFNFLGSALFNGKEIFRKVIIDILNKLIKRDTIF